MSRIKPTLENLSHPTPIIEARNLEIGYVRKNTKNIVFSHPHFEFGKGQLICLAGKNGIGKSTLLRTLARLLPPLAGEVILMGKPIKTYSPIEVAKLISVVLTDPITEPLLTLQELIEMGRFSHQTWYGRLSKKDEVICKEAAETMGIWDLRNEYFSNLSDGQKQRALIARSLAQDTPIMLLDEPTSYLDLPNKIETMSYLKTISAKHQKTIVFSSHDLEFSFGLCDVLCLMTSDTEMSCAPPEDLILNGTFEKTFSHPSLQFNINNGHFENVFIPIGDIQLQGEGHRFFWTERALNRMNYKITNNAPLAVKVDKEGWHCSSTVDKVSKHNTFLTIEELSNFLGTQYKMGESLKDQKKHPLRLKGNQISKE